MLITNSSIPSYRNEKEYDKTDKKESGSLSVLPTELFQKCLSYVESSDVANLRLLRKSWNLIIPEQIGSLFIAELKIFIYF